MKRREMVVGLLMIMAVVGGRGVAAQEVPGCWPVMGGAAADPGAFIRQEANDQTRRLIGELGSGEFEVREKALKELVEKGVDAFPGIVQATKQRATEEAALRVERVAGRFDGSALEGGPLPTALQKYEAGRAGFLRQIDMDKQRAAQLRGRGVAAPAFRSDPIDDLVRQAFWYRQDDERLSLFYEKELAKEVQGELVTMLKAGLVKQAPVQARQLVIAGKSDQALAVLREGALKDAEMRADYAALVAQIRGDAFDPVKELAALGLEKSPADHAQMGMLLSREKGETRAALAFAEQVKDGNYAPRTVFIEAREYGKLAAFAEADSRSPNRRDVLLSYGFAGDTAAYRRVVEQLGGFLGRDQDGEMAVVFSLMQGWQIDKAIAQVTPGDRDYDAAFHFLLQQLRVREALALVTDPQHVRPDRVEHLLALGLNAAARKVMKEMKPDDRQVGKECLAKEVLDYSAALERLGEAQEAVKWRSRAFAMVDEDEARSRPLREQENALREMMRTDPSNVREFIAQRTALVQQLQASQRESRSIGFNYQSLFPDYQSMNEVQFWDQLLEKSPLKAEQRYEKAKKIAAGDLDEKTARDLTRQLVERSQAGAGYLDELKIGVGAFARAKRSDWVFELIAAWEQWNGNPYGWSLAGDLALEKGQPEMAFVYYRRAALYHVTDASLMYRMGVALSRGTAAPAAGRVLVAYAPRLVLGDLQRARDLAKEMRRWEGQDAGDRWFDGWQGRYGRPTPYDLGDRFEHAKLAALARGDLSEALACQAQMLLMPPVQGRNYSWGYMELMAEYQRLRALEGMARGDVKAVAEALELELAYGPPDVAVLEKVVPWLNGKDQAAAKRVVGVAEGRLRAVVEDYPAEAAWREKWEKVR